MGDQFLGVQKMVPPDWLASFALIVHGCSNCFHHSPVSTVHAMHIKEGCLSTKRWASTCKKPPTSYKDKWLKVKFRVSSPKEQLQLSPSIGCKARPFPASHFAIEGGVRPVQVQVHEFPKSWRAPEHDVRGKSGRDAALMCDVIVSMVWSALLLRRGAARVVA